VRRVLAVAIGLLLAPTPGVAQRPSALRASADNDAFNFWVPPWDRPDHEYTSGVRGTVEYDGRLGWRLWPGIARGAPRATTHGFSLGQAIYTGVPQVNTFARPRDWQPDGSGALRPNAGWLYLETAERDSSNGGATEFAVAVGVVGPPALGEQMQRLFHSVVPQFNRPVDWSRQLPFEPGFVARYGRSAALQRFGGDSRWRGAITSEVGASLGTILTELSAGGGATAEFVFGHDARAKSAPRIAVSAGAKARLVARDEFLDGTFFRSSDRVPKRAFVPEERAAIAFRWRQLGIAYRAHHTGRQYDAQPQPVSWATIETEWRFSP